MPITAAAESSDIAGPTPRNILPFVEALGVAVAVPFLLEYGGQVVHIPSAKSRGGRLRRELGCEKAAALIGVFGTGTARIPMAKPWIARQLGAQGLSRAEIAKRLHVSHDTVRGYLAAPREVAA